MLAPIPEYIPPMSQQQIVWLEVYKCTKMRDGLPTSRDCERDAESAVIAFNKLFKEGATL